MKLTCFSQIQYIQLLFFFSNNKCKKLLFVCCSLNDKEQNPLSLYIEQTELQRQILSQFSCVRIVLRVTAIETHENFGLYFKSSGQWMKIRHMTCDVEYGLWYGLLHHSFGVRYLSNNDNTVLQCIR